LAIVTGRVVTSLVAGVFLGSVILAQGHLPVAISSMLEDHLWVSLTDDSHLRVFAFTALMGALVGVIHRAGGMRGVVNVLAPLARSRRSGQLTTWALGLIIFFDDYANTLLLGGTLRPLADRLGISREKLAYLVDSTAAPVAGLAVVSTWVAAEIGFIQAGFAELPLEQRVDGFRLFVASIPYRFYVLWALATVPLVALLQRDLGPMWRAEQRALQALRSAVPPHPLDEPAADERQLPARWHNAVLPVLVVLGVTCWLLIASGRRAAPGAVGWWDAFAQGDALLALLYGSLAGLIAAMLWIRAQRLLDGDQLQSAAMAGARQMLPALIILWLAWTLSAMTGADQLGTAVYLAQWLGGRMAGPWLPSTVFLLASLVAFATGTSWGTMGILMPLVIRLAWQVLERGGVPPSPHDPLLLATVGSVLAGAVFGDHCSPISDTTILSSQASGCDHAAHVRTQLPYALLVGAASILLGTLPAGFGISPWLLLPLGPAAVAAALLLLGKRMVD
jgi:Na+/H+ antiporter NhaC